MQGSAPSLCTCVINSPAVTACHSSHCVGFCMLEAPFRAGQDKVRLKHDTDGCCSFAQDASSRMLIGRILPLASGAILLQPCSTARPLRSTKDFHLQLHLAKPHKVFAWLCDLSSSQLCKGLTLVQMQSTFSGDSCAGPMASPITSLNQKDIAPNLWTCALNICSSIACQM